MACHLGVLLNLPVVGVAKNYLHCVGLTESLDAHRETLKKHVLKKTTDHPILIHSIDQSSEILGAAVWTSSNSKRPVYVSIGNQMNLEQSIQLVQKCSSSHSRVPEPIRQADIYAKFVLSQSKRNKKN